MSVLGTAIVFSGLLSLFIGYYYMSMSQGEKECATIPAAQTSHWSGGIAGIALGIIVAVVGVIYSHGSNLQPGGYESL